MNVSVLIATYGDPQWKTTAERAYLSTLGQDAHEILLRHEDEGTVASSRNALAEQATGDWLLFLDGDDELDANFVAEMAAAVERESTRPALFTPAVCYARRNVRPEPKLWPRMDFKVGNWCVIGTLIQRDLFHQIGGFREYGLYEDYALWAMASVAGAEVFEVPEAVYVAHYGRNSRNRSHHRAEKFYWHQRIGRDVWPDSFDDLTEEEDRIHTLATKALRFTP